MQSQSRNNPSFTDSKGRTWQMVLSIGMARTIRDQVGIDFLNITDAQLFTALANDYEKLGQTLWLFVEEQAATRRIEPEDFIGSLTGPALDNAMEAMAEAIASFIPAPMRGPLRKLLATLKEAETEASKIAEDWIATEASSMKSTAATTVRKALETSGT